MTKKRIVNAAVDTTVGVKETSGIMDCITVRNGVPVIRGLGLNEPTPRKDLPAFSFKAEMMEVLVLSESSEERRAKKKVVDEYDPRSEVTLGSMDDYLGTKATTPVSATRSLEERNMTKKNITSASDEEMASAAGQHNEAVLNAYLEVSYCEAHNPSKVVDATCDLIRALLTVPGIDDDEWYVTVDNVFAWFEAHGFKTEYVEDCYLAVDGMVYDVLLAKCWGTAEEYIAMLDRRESDYDEERDATSDWYSITRAFGNDFHRF